MNTKTRKIILRANAIYLLVASLAGLRMDMRASFFSTGVQAPLIALAPHTGIGFIEAHGLAFIIGMLLLRAAPLRSWHLAGMAVHVLLGTSNLVFWQIFIAADILAVGYITTSLHWTFAALQLFAALSEFGASPDRRVAA